jgi:hypothetical protein
MRVDAPIALTRLFSVPVFDGLEALVGVLFIALAGVAIGRFRESPHECAGYGLSSTLAILSTLLAVHLQVYDTTLIALPMVLAFASKGDPWEELSLGARAMAGAPLVFLWFNFFATDTVLRILGLTTEGLWRICGLAPAHSE